MPLNSFIISMMIINMILYFIQKCLSFHWAHICEQNIYPKRYIVWSDGHATHFKGSCSWLYTMKYQFVTINPKFENAS
jgi:hypothetical protein